MYGNGFFNRPFLHHGYGVFFTICIHNYGNRIQNFKFTSFNYRFYGIKTFHFERNHNFVWLKIFVYFAQPCSGFHFITHFGNRLKAPEFLCIKRIVIFSTLQKYTCEFVEVVLQAIVIARKQSRAKCNFEQMPHKFHIVAYFQSARTFKNLHKNIFSDYFQYFGHQFLST